MKVLRQPRARLASRDSGVIVAAFRAKPAFRIAAAAFADDSVRGSAPVLERQVEARELEL